MALMLPDMQAVGTHGWFITDNSGGDTTPPSPVTALAVSSVAATSITVTFTVPTDADYDYVEVYAVALDGGTSASTTSAASPATVSGLSLAQRYAIVVIALDTTGNRSTPVAVTAMTLASSGATYPHRVYWYLDRKAAAHDTAPVDLDATTPITSAKLETQRVQLHAGQVKSLRLRGILVGPVKHFELLELGLVWQAPPDRPQGRGLE